MPVFEQTFLKPGRYFVGRNAAGEKQYLDLTPDQIREYAEGTRGLIAAGYRPPVLLEHAAPNTTDGAPVLTRDAKAAAVKHGVGWLRDVKVGDDGTAIHTFDVRDKAVAEQIKSGAIQFTSPELRPAWTDGKGVDHKHIIAHVALTHKPRNPDQSPPVEVAGASAAAMQFSLADFEGPVPEEAPIPLVQMSDDEPPVKSESADEKPPEVPAAPPVPENPDAPADTAKEQQFQALLAQLKTQLNIDLASDTAPDTLVRDLLIALKTLSAADAAAEAEAAVDDEEINPDAPGDDLTEDRGPMQFSLADIEAGGVPNRLLARVVKSEHDTVVAQLDALIAGGHAPALKARLLERPATIQFSADGDPLPAFTLAEVVSILADTLPAGVAWEGPLSDATQFAADEHPSGPAFFSPPADAQEITPEAAKARVDALARSNPTMFRQTA